MYHFWDHTAILVTEVIKRSEVKDLHGLRSKRQIDTSQANRSISEALG